MYTNTITLSSTSITTNNDLLFFKIFKNKFLFNLIFNFIKNLHQQNNDDKIYKPLIEIKLKKILLNKKLFQLLFNSYIFNKNKGDLNYCKNILPFKNLNQYIDIFFESPIITFNQFKIIFDDFYNDIFSKDSNKDLLLKYCILNNTDNGIEYLKYLINQYSFRFNYNNNNEFNEFQKLILLICKSSINSNNPNIINYLILYFKKYSNNNNFKSIYLKSNNLPIEALFNCIELEKVGLYRIIFNMSLNSLIDENGNDIDNNNKRDKFSKRNQLLVKIVEYGSLEMAEIYCEKFKYKKSLNQESIKFFNLKDETKSLQAYTILVKNGILIANIHSPFSSFSYLETQSVKIFKPLIQFSDFNIGNQFRELNKVKDVKTLKFFIKCNEKSIFKNKIQFNIPNLLNESSIENNFELVQYLVESPLFNAKPSKLCSPCITSDSRIIKYLLLKFNDYKFYDYLMKWGADETSLKMFDFEFIKFIIEQHNQNNNQIVLTDKFLGLLCLNGDPDIIQYVLKNTNNLKISENAINLAICSKNLKIIELLKNIEPTNGI